MRILFISHFFPPEEPPAAFLAFEFAKAVKEAGHDVDVLTGFPNWPSGRVFPNYNSRRMTIENIENIHVRRLPFLASPSGGFVRRALDFTSFQFLVRWYGRKLPRPDLIYVLVPPNEDGIAARSIASYFDCPYILNVQDMHPDTSINLGYIKNRLLILLLKHQEKTMYSNAEHVVTIGSYMRQALIDKGIPPKRVSILHNWIDTNAIVPKEKSNCLRKEWSIAEEAFVVLYAGTFGRIHGTSILLEIAKNILKKNMVFLLVGQGYDFDQLVEKVNRGGYSNVLLKPFVPRKRLSELQALADISMVLTRKGFGLTSVPSKVLGYMAAARPVLAMVDKQSDTASLIASANAGVVVNPENLTEAVLILVDLYNDRSILHQWGECARSYILKHHSSDVVLAKGVSLLEEVAREAIKKDAVGHD